MKSPGLSLQSPSLAVHYIKMKYSVTDTILSSGTGFIYLFDDFYYLITNGHNITGVNPETKERLSQHAGIPDRILMKGKYQPNENSIGLINEPFYIDLYKDTNMFEPLWYVHPKHGYEVDVVAVPIISKQEMRKDIKLYPINNFDLRQDIYPVTSDEVFVLGFPFDITDNLELPIWKRGSVATEPSFNIKGLPKIYIDTATRSGMSGSPVIFKRTGVMETVNFKETKSLNDLLIGTIHSFLGVYSGRIGAKDELGAQLGIVWKEEVINEILENKTLGTCEFQNQ